MKRIKELCLLLALTGLSQITMAALPVTSGLVMNLDADNISPSSTGTNGEVTVWPDLTANSNNAEQSSAGNCPVLVSANTDFKGHATVRFDGVNDWMSLNNDMVNVGSFTMFAVGKYVHIDGEQYLINGQSTDGGDNRIRFAMNAQNFAWRSGTSGEYRHTPNLDVNVFGSTSSAKFYLNGDKVATYTNTSSQYPKAFGLGSYSRGYKAFMEGDIAAVIIFNRELTEEEIGQMNSYLMNKYMVTVTNPVPADGAVGVGEASGDNVMVTLQWDAAPDPMDAARVDSDIVKHYVYMTQGNGDPNMYKVGEVSVTDYSSLTSALGPIALDFDSTYSWQVIEVLSDGHGGVLAENDPNNYVGDKWTFTGLLSVPVVTTQPTSVKTIAGETVSFTTEYTSVSPATVTWYKDGDEVQAGSRISIASEAGVTTLTISDLIDSDQGNYYCILHGGGDTTSNSAVLIFRKMLARYEFEQNLDDDMGLNNGTAVGSVSYSPGIEGGYAAQTMDGEGYIELSTSAYPKSGLGNGLEQFTYSFWIKPSASMGVDDNGRILGNFNDGQYTGMQVGVKGDGSLTSYLRTDSGTSGELITSAGSIPSEQWSHIVLTFSGTELVFYVNGSLFAQKTVNKMTNFTQWQYPMECMAKNLRGVVTEFYSGLLDKLEIYNYPMDEYQVADIYIGVTGEPVCIESLRPSGSVDLNGDCVVNVLDFADIAENWLDCGIYPTCVK